MPVRAIKRPVHNETPAGDYPTFVMSPPLYLSNENPNNALMREHADEEIDRDRAFRQFLDLYNFVAANNLVYLLPAVPGLQDQTYVSNLAVSIGGKIVISKFKSPPRKGEAPIGEAYFKSLLLPTMECPFFFEGEADLKPLNAKQWIGGYGQRTEAAALNWFARQFDVTVFPVEMTDPECYHMDCVACPLTSDHLMLATDLINDDELADLENVANVISVSTELAHAGITNCVRLGRLLLCDSSAPSLKESDEEYAIERMKEVQLEGICAILGLEPVFFDMSEFEKSGAALSCQIMHLNRPDISPAEDW